MTDSNALAKVSEYMQSPTVRARISDIIGAHNAGAYIGSVLLAVANSKSLQECTPASIYTAAMDAAILRLSVSPSTGQAYLVAYDKVATLIVGYKGLYHMALRTGKYRYINVGKIYEGETVEEDRLTGLHKISGGRESDKVIGLIGAFEMVGERGGLGLAHTTYMTIEEIHTHARRFSKMYNSPSGGWKTNTETMEKKTVLRRLLSRWGYLDPVDAQTLERIEDQTSDRDELQPDTVEGEVVEQDVAPDRMSKQQIMGQLGFGF